MFITRVRSLPHLHLHYRQPPLPSIILFDFCIFPSIEDGRAHKNGIIPTSVLLKISINRNNIPLLNVSIWWKKIMLGNRTKRVKVSSMECIREGFIVFQHSFQKNLLYNYFPFFLNIYRCRNRQS